MIWYWKISPGILCLTQVSLVRPENTPNFKAKSEKISKEGKIQ